MKAICNNLRITYTESGTPELTLSLTCSRHEIAADIADLREVLAKGKMLSVEVKKHSQKRSLDSNGYLWILCQKIAEKLRNHTKEDVYKEAVRKAGQFEYLAVSEDAAEQFIKVWNGRGLGWYAEEMDSRIQGCKKIMAYYGSSVYDSRQMAVLIDYVVQEAKELGVETMTPAEISRMNEEWGK